MMARKTFSTLSASTPLLLISILLSLACLADASCYYPDGSLSPNDRPCTDKTPDSVCCGQGFACLSNGICQATGDELKKPGASKYVRGSCTDKDWRSSSCPLFCIDPNNDFLGGGMGIFKCSDTTKDLYLCINKENINFLDDNDCEKDSNALYFPGTPTAITTIGVRATSTTPKTSTTSKTSKTSTTLSTSTTTTPEITSSTMPPTSETPKVHGGNDSNSNSATTSPTQTPVDSSPPTKSPNGAVIGGAVGGALGGVAVIGIVAWLLVSRRRTRQLEQQEQQLTGPVFEADSTYAFEMIKKPKGSIFSPAVHEAPGWSVGQQVPHYHPQAEVYEVE